MSNLAAGIPIGLAAGIGSGIAIGTGAGKAAAKKEISERIREYAATHTMIVTDGSGTTIDLDNFIEDIVQLPESGPQPSSVRKTAFWVILGTLVAVAGALVLFFLLR